MSDVYLVEPHRGGEDQVGLHVRCDTEAEAEQLQRLLRARWRLSPVLPSIYKGRFTHFFYITTTEQELTAVWPEIEKAAFGVSRRDHTVKPQPARSERFSSGGNVANVPTYKDWHQQFSAALTQLQKDVESRPLSTGRFGIGSVDRLLNQGQLRLAEDDLLRAINEGQIGALRPLIHLYHASNQYDEVVKLFNTYEEQILALPASGALAKELVASHLTVRSTDTEQVLIDRARSIARDMLPELERLRQAEAVRALLQSIQPEIEEQQETLPLSERLRVLLDLPPQDRIPQLESLIRELPQAHVVTLALADAFVAADREADGLRMYQSIPADSPEHAAALQRAADLLLRQGRYLEVVSLLGQQNLTPALEGRLGAARFALGHQSRELLEKAWNGGVRSPLVVRPLARLLFRDGDYERAAEIYQMLDHDAPEMLSAYDYYVISELADTEMFGQLLAVDILAYYDRCLQQSRGSNLDPADLARAIKQRANIARRTEDPDRILDTHADWLENLAEQGTRSEIGDALDVLESLRFEGLLSNERYFELLETLETTTGRTDVHSLLIGQYQSIAFREIDDALRETRLEDAFFRDLLTSIFHLSKSLHDQIISYRSERREETAEAQIEIVPEAAQQEPLSLMGQRIALVGGHERTRREVAHELTERYGAVQPVEVAPSSDAHFDRSSVQSKIQSCSLIAVITGYMGHDLSTIVRQLDDSQSLAGKVLWLSCRGKSGVVREIIKATQQS